MKEHAHITAPTQRPSEQASEPALAEGHERPRGHIVLNFSEGYGKSTPAEQRRYFRIARGSAYEVAAALDVARAFGVVAPEAHATGKDLCDHLAGMLTRFRSAAHR